MSKTTKKQVLFQLRCRYVAAGREHKRQLIMPAVELPGAIARRPFACCAPAALALILGRPQQYHPDTLLPIL